MAPHSVDSGVEPIEGDGSFAAPVAPKAARVMTLAEVALHASKDDAYLIIRDRVYDVSKFAEVHPGGKIILTYAGEDATDVFAAFHPSMTHKQLAPYLVGELMEKEKDKTTAFVKDIRRMRNVFRDAGYFKSSKLYYAFKCLSNIAILAGSIYLASQNTLATATLGGFFLALFWQQCGWLSHDFLHHQVFENRNLNNIVGFIFGDVFQGFSVAWWKDKHNTHHAVPNVHGADPDIATMPFLAWSEHALEGFADPAARETLPKFMIDHQVYFYPPLMMAARLSWALQSLLYVVHNPKMRDHGIESVAIAAHWLGLAAILGLCMSPVNALVYFIVSQTMCGLLLASVFALNHNGMTVMSKEESKSVDYYTRQIVTGRDVNPTVFVSWFAGGLNYQIEHHLFPQLPRHNFHKVQPQVLSLCKKYNIPYHRTGFWQGTWEVVNRLATVETKSRAL